MQNEKKSIITQQVDSAAPVLATAAAPANPLPRKARWGRRIALAALGFFVLLLILVVAAPSILSMKVSRDLLLGRVNSTIAGVISADDFSLSWNGPISLSGLSIADPAKSEVIHMDNISITHGVWQLLTGGLNLGEVTMENGRVLVQIEPDHSVSIANAIASKNWTPAGTARGGTMPEVHGTFIMKNVAVQVVQADGRSLEASQVEADLKVRTLSNLSGRWVITLKDGGRFDGTIDLRDLFDRDGLTLDKANGLLKLSTPTAIPMGPLARFASGRQKIEGSANLDVDAKFEGASVQALVTADLHQVLDRNMTGPNSSPLDVVLKSDVTTSGDRVTARVDINSSAGTAQVEARYAFASNPSPINAQSILDAVLNSRSLQWPDFDLKVAADIDLAEIERAVPGVIKFKEGQRLTSGRLEIAHLNTTGSTTPSAMGSMLLKGLAFEDGDRLIRFEPISCTFDGSMESGKGLEFRAFDLNAGFARVQGSGTAKSMSTEFAVDFQRLGDELGAMVDLSNLDVGGEMTGKATLTRVGDDRCEVNWESRGTRITYADAGQPNGIQPEPIDLTIVGQGSYQNKRVAVLADAETTAGKVKIEGRFDFSSHTESLTAEQVLSAVLTGSALQLPEFDMQTEGAIDLAVLERALPGIIKIKQGRQLTGGRFQFNNVIAQGGASPQASGTVQLKELASEGAGAGIHVEPMSLTFDMRILPGVGLEIRTADWVSSFARVQAGGLAPNLNATFETNLTKIKQEMNQFVDMGGYDLAGQVTGTLSVSRESDERVDVKMQVSGSQVRYRGDQRQIEIPTLSVQESGWLAMLNNRPQRFTSEQTTLDLAGQLEAAGTGYYDFNTKGYAADIDAKRIEVGFLQSQLAAWGVSALDRYGGTLSLKTKVAQQSADRPITTSGTLVAHELHLDDLPVGNRDTTLNWSDAQFDPQRGVLLVGAANIDSDLAHLVADDFQLTSQDKLAFSGKVDASADIAAVLRVMGTVIRMENPPTMSGQLTLNATAAAEGGMITVTGSGGVDQWVAGSGPTAFREDRVRFEVDARMDKVAESINVTQFRLTSAPLSATMSGTIEQYHGPIRLALRGRYDSDWDRLTAIIHQFAPATAETVIIKGKTGSDFQINGIANDPAAHPAFRGLASSLNVDWSTAGLYGVQTGPAKFTPTVKDGQLTLPLTSITAADGKINLRGVLDFQPAEPTLKIDGSLPLLDNVSLNNRLAHDVLSWLNPVFLNVLQIDGKARLDIQNVMMPLGESRNRTGNGKGRLDLKAVRIKPSGLIAELVALGGLADKNMYNVQFNAVDFVVRDGRIHYEDFTMLFPGEFDIKFRGSVGLDSTLDLVVSLPVRPALLEKLGVKGIPSDYAKMLSKSRVDLPLVGTRAQPSLDFSKIDTKALLKGLAPTLDSPANAAEELLKKLGGPKKSKP